MRVLVVSNLYPPDFLGGYELGCRQVTDALRAVGHEVQVLAANPGGRVTDPPHVKRRLRLADIYDAHLAAHSRTVALANRFVEAHAVQAANVHALIGTPKEFRPDVVYLWNLIGLGGLGLMAAVQKLGYPWVMHVMDAVPRALASLPFAPVPQVGTALARLLRGRYLCCSETVLAENVAGGVPIRDQAVVLPNWVVLPPLAGPREYMPDGVLRVVSAGSVSASKGVDVLIRAVGQVRDRGLGDRLSVDIYGTPTDPSFAALIRELGLNATVRLMGPRTQAELGELYANYDVFAFPTWAREPMAFAPMEAAARGCLMLTSRLSGNAEWFLDGTECVKADRTPEGFADALAALAAGEQPLPDIAGRGCRAVHRWFHLDRVLPRIEAELKAAARRPPVAPPASADEVYRLALLGEKLAYMLVQERFAA